MHVLIASLYAFIIWLALLAYVAILGGPWLLVLGLSPIIISGAVLGILILDAAVVGIHWLWRNRATFRWWRTTEN